MQAHARTHIAHTHEHARMNTHAQTHARTHAHTPHTQTRAHTHAHTRAHTHTHFFSPPPFFFLFFFERQCVGLETCQRVLCGEHFDKTNKGDDLKGKERWGVGQGGGRAERD